MISTIRSIDSLFNQFDELTKGHSSLLADFENNFTDIKNPLRPVARRIDEPRKPIVNNLLDININNDQFEYIGSIENFRRRIIKYREVHRPTNDTISIQRVSSKSFGTTTTDPVSLSKVLIANANNYIDQPKIKISIKEEPKLTPRRQARGKITAFTMETINRLSKPKRYNRSPDPKNDTLKGSSLPTIKQSKINTNNSSPTTIKIEPKILTQTSSKKTPNHQFFRPLVLITSMPTSRPKVRNQSPPKIRHHK